MARQSTEDELKKIAGEVKIDDSLLKMFLGNTWEELEPELELFLVSASAAGLDKNDKRVRELLESKDVNPLQAVLYKGTLNTLRELSVKENFTEITKIMDSILSVYSILG